LTTEISKIGNIKTDANRIIQADYFYQFLRKLDGAMAAAGVSRVHTNIPAIKGLLSEAAELSEKLKLTSDSDSKEELLLTAISGLQMEIFKIQAEIGSAATGTSDAKVARLKSSKEHHERSLTDMREQLSSVLEAKQAVKRSQLRLKDIIHFLGNYIKFQNAMVSSVSLLIPKELFEVVDAESDEENDFSLSRAGIQSLADSRAADNDDEIIDAGDASLNMLSIVNRPFSDFTKFWVLQEKLLERYGIKKLRDANEFKQQLRSLEIFGMQENNKFIDWSKRMNSYISLLRGEFKMDKLDILDLYLFHLTYIDRFDKLVQEFSNKLEDDSDKEKLLNQRLESIWRLFEQVDDHYFKRNNVIPSTVVVEVNLGYFKLGKTGINAKSQAYGGQPRKAANVYTGGKKPTCFHCGREGHKISECRDRANGLPKVFKRKSVHSFNNNGKKQKSSANVQQPAAVLDKVSAVKSSDKEKSMSTSFPKNIKQIKFAEQNILEVRAQTAFEINVVKSNAEIPEFTIIDGGSMVHVFPAKPDNFQPGINRGARHLIFGNDKSLPIDGVGCVGDLKDVMVCSSMSKAILSNVKLATDNNVVTISTSEGMLMLKAGEAPIVREDQILCWVELRDGLYRAKTKDILSAFSSES